MFLLICGLSLLLFISKALLRHGCKLMRHSRQHSVSSWAELCVSVESKFGRDLYHHSMNDLLQIRQTADVQEYYDRFENAMHKVLVHNSSLDDVFFVSKFL